MYIMKHEHITLDCCDSIEVHQELLNIVNKKLPQEEVLYDLAELFKVFGDSTRIRILFVLFEAEVCVCDLAAALNMTQSAVSHQLRILKQNKLVRSRREGKSVFYSLADAHVRAIRDWSMSRRSSAKNTSRTAGSSQEVLKFRTGKTQKRRFSHKNECLKE